MHSLKPYGNHIYAKGGLSDDDQAASRSLLKRLNNAVDIYGVDSLKMVYTLPSGATAIASEAGGVMRLIVIDDRTDEKKPELPPEFATDYIPMLFSGVIRNGIARSDVPIRVEFTDETLRRLAAYSDENEKRDAESVAGAPVMDAPKSAELMRFNVPMPEHLAELKGLGQLSNYITQFARGRPCWWSGSMASVIQVVGGYGSRDFENLPDEPLEQVRFTLPANVMEQVRAEISGVRLPGYTGMPHRLGQFQYDYKHSKTHGVSFDANGKPWLIEVSKDGVYAMPLPIVPATATKAFRECIEEVGDHEILLLLDRFGGLPSGETFPEDKEAWRRAGVVIKLCDTADFYDLDPMSTACGWSFNESGTEAFNTGTRFEGGMEVPHCSGYKLRIRIDGAEDNGWSYPQEGISEHGRLIDRYIRELYSVLPPGEERTAAIKYKIRRVPIGTLVAKAKAGNGADDADYWDSLEIDPISTATAKCSRVSDGPIYSDFLPSFKLPEPVLEGCVSHSMVGMYEVDQPEKYPRCDTILFGYYIGDDLKVVKYFRDDRELESEGESDFEPCMTVGDWTEIKYTAPAKIVGNLYTTDFDDRIEASESYILTEVTSRDLGYPSRPTLAFHAYFWKPATVRRSRYYSRVDKVTKHFGRRRSMYCYVPFLMRDALVYGFRDVDDETKYSEYGRRLSVPDPHSYDAWTYDSSWHWAAFDMDTSWMDSPAPHKTSPPNPVWLERHNYNPTSECSDWADSGEFVPGELPFDWSSLKIADNGNIILLNNPEPKPPYNDYRIEEDNVDPEETHSNSVDIWTSPVELSDKPVSDHHFGVSPDAWGNVFSRSATRIEFGHKTYSVINDTGGNGPGVKEFGHTEFADKKTTPQFIGVINE